MPGFRITAPIRPGYRLEGTEDTTDDCYLKRHQKYEAEEIRIKRWDMRRQKEEFERNKLLKGRYYSKSNVSASNSKTSKSSASSSSSSAPPSADPSNSSLAASDFKPVLGPYGIYYKKFDPLQIDGSLFVLFLISLSISIFYKHFYTRLRIGISHYNILDLNYIILNL